VNEAGTAPESYAVRIDGRDHVCRPAVKAARPDVQAKLGLAAADVGYKIKIPLAGPPGPQLLAGFAVFAADNGTPTGTAFTLGPKVRAVLPA
jgi:hypothetical protein